MHYTLAGWRIDTRSRTAQRHGRTENLSPRAIKFLDALVSAEGEVVSRSDLIEEIWPDVFVGDDSLTQIVSEVRRKLDDRALIETVSRGGYSLTVPVFRDVTTVQGPLKQQRPEDFNFVAHALCLEARSEMVRCGAGSMARAEALTAEAVELAPECAVTRADRSIALVRLHMYWSQGQDMLHRAVKEAEQSIVLDPTCARGHSALGYALCAFEHWAAAEASHARALACDGRDPVCYHNAAWLMMSEGKNRAAVTFFERVGDLDPDNIKGYLQAARLSLRDDPERSRRNAERALRRAEARLAADPDDTRARTACGMLMALLGEAASAFTTISSIDVSDSAQAIYHASTYAMIGELDQALRTLEALFDNGWRDMHWLDADPTFANIATDQRFLRMRRNVRAA